MTDEKPMFEVRGVQNPYPHEGKRPETLWYLDGPGSPGYHGATLSGHLYWDSYEEALRAAPMMEQAYKAGIAAHRKVTRDAMLVLLGGANA